MGRSTEPAGCHEAAECYWLAAASSFGRGDSRDVQCDERSVLSMAHLKVLLTVHQFFPRGYHGTERYTLDLATELTRAGHEVVILTASQSPEDSTGEDVIEYEYNGLRVRAIDLVQNS